MDVILQMLMTTPSRVCEIFGAQSSLNTTTMSDWEQVEELTSVLSGESTWTGAPTPLQTDGTMFSESTGTTYSEPEHRPSEKALLCGSPKKLEATSTQKIRKISRRRPKEANPKPANYCHICWRSTKRVKVAVCSKNVTGECRKVVCETCFYNFGWNWETASKGTEAGGWLCTHCTNECPQRSQCFVYKRTNERRKEERAARKLRLKMGNNPSGIAF